MSDLLKIAMAENDDMAAYCIQGQLRKILRPFSLRRIIDPEFFLFELGRFSPDLLLFDDTFAPLNFISGLEKKPKIIVLSHSTDPASEAKVGQPGVVGYLRFPTLANLQALIEKTFSFAAPGELWQSSPFASALSAQVHSAVSS